MVPVPGYPRPHIEKEWNPSVKADYRNAKSDDERRRILLVAGYDQAHESEVKRLFDEPLKLEKRKKDEEKKSMVEKLKRYWKPIAGIFSAVIIVLTFFNLLPGAWDGFLWLVDRIRSIF